MLRSLTVGALRQAGGNGALVERERRRMKAPLPHTVPAAEVIYRAFCYLNAADWAGSTVVQPRRVLHCTERPWRAAARSSVAGDQHARRPAASVLFQIHLRFSHYRSVIRQLPQLTVQPNAASQLFLACSAWRAAATMVRLEH